MDTEALLDQLERGSPQETHVLQPEQLSFEQLTGHPAEPDEADAARPSSSTVAKTRTPYLEEPETGRHQDVRLYLTVLLKSFVEMTDAGVVRNAPFRVYLDDGTDCEPDIVFIAHANFDRLHESHIEGPPDIVVEVLSSESTAQDRGEKFAIYERAGVREYWLIDPVRELANLYHLGPDGYYDEFRPDTMERLRSRVLRAFVLNVDLLWQRVLPTTAEIVGMVESMLSQR